MLIILRGFGKIGRERKAERDKYKRSSSWEERGWKLEINEDQDGREDGD